MQRHRHQEFIRFLNGIERQVPAGKVIHVILDNYAAHKHPKVRTWLGAPSPLGLPLHADLVLLAERRRGLLRQADPAAPETRAPSPRLVEPARGHQPLHRRTTTRSPAPFVWKADPKDIIAAAKRGHQTLQTIH